MHIPILVYTIDIKKLFCRVAYMDIGTLKDAVECIYYRTANINNNATCSTYSKSFY